MPKSQFVDFRAVKAAVTIVQVLEHYDLMSKLHRNGDTLTGPCPIHGGDNETAFRVSISKNCWNCFSRCGGGGNVLDFVARKEGVSVLRAGPNPRDARSGRRNRRARRQARPQPRRPRPRRSRRGRTSRSTSSSSIFRRNTRT